MSDYERTLRAAYLENQVEDAAYAQYLKQLDDYRDGLWITESELDQVRNNSTEYLKLRGKDAFNKRTATYLSDAAHFAVLRWIAQGCWSPECKST